MNHFRTSLQRKLGTVLLGLAGFALATAAHADYTNGNFETGDFTGWTVQGHSIPAQIPTFPPATVADLGLGAGTSMSAVLPAGSAATTNNILTWSSQAARIHDEVAGSNNRASSITQRLTVGPGDLDPDGKVHVRFSAAPVLQDPGHAPNEQPYFFIELTNITQATSVFHTFNFANESGVPWQTYGGNTFTDWQAFDIPLTVGTDVVMGDEIELVLVGAGCGQSGHAGALYVDNVRTQLAIAGASAWITTAGPATMCLSPGGTTVTYTYTFQNNGSDPLTNVAASLVMPQTSDANVALFVSITNPTFGGGTCAGPVNPGDPATCNIGTLQPGDQGTFSMTVQIPAGATGTSINNGNYVITGVGGTAVPVQVSQLGPLFRTILTVCAAPPPTLVPTLGEWGLLLLAGLLALWGAFILQRRSGRV